MDRHQMIQSLYRQPQLAHHIQFYATYKNKTGTRTPLGKFSKFFFIIIILLSNHIFIYFTYVLSNFFLLRFQMYNLVTEKRTNRPPGVR